MFVNPIDALAAVRVQVESLLTLGAPAVSIVGFEGVSAPYPCCTNGALNGVLGVEWDSINQLPESEGCGSVWRINAVVRMRRCWPSFNKVAGITDGNPPPPADVQARSSAFSNEAWTVATGLVVWALSEHLDFTVDEVWPFGPEGECAGWDIKFMLDIYACEGA